jgi:ABC-type branched-subunit amino acid transport system ATPase component/sugar phosphate permease/plastocyanin
VTREEIVHHEGLERLVAEEGQTAARRTLRAVLRDATDFSLLRKSQYGLTPLLVLGFISFFQRFDSAAFSLAGPEIARELNIDVGDIIGLLAMVGTVAAFGSLWAGWYADRHRRTPFVGIGTAISGIFSILTGRGTSFAGVATPRVIDETADAASSVPQFALLADYYAPTERGKAFAFLGMLGRSAAILAPMLVGWSVVELGWQTSFAIFGAPLVVMGVIAFFALKEPIRGYHERKALGADEETARTEDEPQSFGEAWRTTFAVRTIRRATVATVFTGAGDYIFALLLPFFLAEKYGLSALERGVISIPGVITAIAGALIGGSLVDSMTKRNPSRVMVIVGVFGLIPTFGILAWCFEPPLWTLIVFGAVINFGSGMIGPASSVVFAQVIPPSIRTQGLQLTALAILPTTILFLPMARYLRSEWDYQGPFILALVLGVFGGIVWLTSAGFFEIDMRNALAASLAGEEWRKAKLAGSTKLLVCRNVDVGYDGVQVLFDVDFDVDEGSIVALLGTNGAGKSTLLRALCGTQEASGGAIVFDGRDITHMPTHEIAGRGVVQMPGGRGVFPGLSVRENLVLGTWLTEDATISQTRLAEVMEIFPDLRERLDLNAGDLSGGQQQQLSLAQAFLSDPKLLLIDELSLGLSPVVVGQLIEIVKEINKRGVTVIVVEQSVNVALTIADRAVFMEKGEIRFDGPTSDLLARPDILRAVYVKGTAGVSETPGGARRAHELAEARPVLEVENLVKRYGGVVAVDGVSFELREGEVLGLIGPNGAGKTTIFEMISGHQRADGGVVRFEGVDITELSAEARAQRKIIRRFQDARLFPSLTVHETLLVALEARLEVRSAILGAFGAPQVRKAERRVRLRADKLIELLGLGAYRDKFVKELSTGLRRIVDLACVLAAEPRVLLLDEPSSGIAQAEAESLAPLLQRVRFETGCSILIIEHDMPLISAVSDELIAFDQGALVVRGTPEVVLSDERVVESYLGTTEAAVQLRAIASAVAVVAVLAGCSSDEKVGDESSLAFDQEQAEQFGATTSTTEAGVTETTSPGESTTTTGAATNTTLAPEEQEVTIDVSINDQSPYFDPGLVQVRVGSKIRFTNRGASDHSVTSDTGAFDSGPIAPGAAWIFEANTPGSFNYSDSARPFAVGTIQVS